MASYELRLLDTKARTQKVFKFECASDASAAERILRVGDAYDRYELWRGMQMIDAGARFIIATPRPCEHLEHLSQ